MSASKKEKPTEVRVTMTMTIEQAYAARESFEIFMRLCLGQIEQVEELVRFHTIPMSSPSDTPRQNASMEVCDKIREHLDQVKQLLGYPVSGSMGIGHRHVDVSGTRAYELYKVLAQALANHQDPNPKMRGTHYDGLVVRYTQDPAPIAVIGQVENGKASK